LDDEMPTSNESSALADSPFAASLSHNAVRELAHRSAPARRTIFKVNRDDLLELVFSPRTIRSDVSAKPTATLIDDFNSVDLPFGLIDTATTDKLFADDWELLTHWLR
jgi:hypothetical protein